MSSLLGKYKHVEMYFPGGCKIGARPIDQTLKGFEALGATIKEEDNKLDKSTEVPNFRHLSAANVTPSLMQIYCSVSVVPSVNFLLMK